MIQALRAPAAVVAGALLLVLAPAVHGQGKKKQEEPPPIGGYVEHVDVNIVSVDVVVTDKQGNRVTGLLREDFELLEDNRPVSISHFYAVEGPNVRVVRDTGEGTPQTATIPAAKMPETLARRFVFYVDNLNLRPFSRNRTLAAVRSFAAENIRPGDEAMVVTFDRSVKIRQQLTAERSDVINALEGLEGESALAGARDSARQAALQQINDAKDPDRAVAYAKSYAREVENDVTTSIEGLKTVIDSLAGLEGRKLFFYVSEGMPQTPGAELFHYIQEKFGNSAGAVSEMMSFNGSRKLLQVVSAANSQNVVIYTIDAGGLRMDAGTSAEFRGGEHTLDMAMARQNETDPLRVFADETGGTAILNSNDAGIGLAKVAMDLATYYSLGYSPSHAGDGRYHPLEVRVKRKGLKARARSGYRDKSAEARLEDRILSLLYFGKEDNPLGVEVVLSAPRRGGEGNYLIGVEVRIPIKSVTLLPDPLTGNFKGGARIHFSALDGDGNRSPMATEIVSLDIPADKKAEAMGKFQTFAAQLQARPGRQRFAVAVRDQISGQTSYLVRQGIAK